MTLGACMHDRSRALQGVAPQIRIVAWVSSAEMTVIAVMWARFLAPVPISDCTRMRVFPPSVLYLHDGVCLGYPRGTGHADLRLRQSCT